MTPVANIAMKWNHCGIFYIILHYSYNRTKVPQIGFYIITIDIKH